MSEDFESERSRLDWRLDDLTRDYPLDLMTARRFGAACLRRIPTLLPSEVAATVAAWEEEAACVGGPAAAVNYDDWAIYWDVWAAPLEAVWAVWDGDARAAAAKTVYALGDRLLKFIECALRAGLREVASPSGRFEKTDRPGYDTDDFVGDTFVPAWDEVWQSPPLKLPQADWEYLSDHLRGRFGGDGLRRLMEEWLEGSWTSYEVVVKEMLETTRRAVRAFCERETDRQADLLDELVRDGAEMDRSERKMRLYAAARARLSWHLLTDERSRRAVEVAERFADGFGSAAELEKALNAAFDAEWDAAHAFSTDPSEGHILAYQVAVLASAPAHDNGRQAYEGSRTDAPNPTSSSATGDLPSPDAARLEACWRDAGVVDPAWLDEEMFGDPARPVAFNPVWATETVLALARSMYLDHAFDAMPILADALQDSGCEDAAILDHCRRGGPHARGCWVLDLILRKR